MGYVLGLDLGTSRTAAAVWRNGRADVIPLSDHAATMPSMVFVRDGDDGLLVGEAARRRGNDDPSRLAREFKRRFGDATPLVLGTRSLSAEQLTVAVLRHVVDFVAQREGGAPDRIVVAHPANWGSYRRDLLRAEVTAAGFGSVRMVTEPDAAAVHYASGERVVVGDVIAVYDLGGGTFDASVLRRTADGFVQVGEPKGIERLGGADFDEALFQYVVEQSGLDETRLTAADRIALLRVRDECRSAKEALSDDLEATVPVHAGGVNTSIKLTRADLEQMIRPALRESVQCLRTAILDSGVRTQDISAVLMVGGSSRIPLAAELVRTEIGRPVVYTSNPKEAVALGAARIGGAQDAPPGLAGAGPASSTPRAPTTTLAHAPTAASAAAGIAAGAAGPVTRPTTAVPGAAPAVAQRVPAPRAGGPGGPVGPPTQPGQRPGAPASLAPTQAMRTQPLPGQQPPGHYPPTVPVPVSGGPARPAGRRISPALMVLLALLVGGGGVGLALLLNRSGSPTTQPTTPAPPVSAPPNTIASTTSKPSSTTTRPTSPPTSPPTTPPTAPGGATVPPDPVAVAQFQLGQLVSGDQATVTGLVEHWVPQLSAKRNGLHADGIVYDLPAILQDHLHYRTDFGAVIADGGQFNFRLNGGPMTGWFITLIPEAFPDPAGALQWCTDHAFGKNDCVGKFLSADPNVHPPLAQNP